MLSKTCAPQIIRFVHSNHYNEVSNVRGANWDAAINWDKNPIVFFTDNLETYHKYYLKRPGVNHGG